MNLAVEIMVMIDSYKLYHVGEGRLTHGEDGFRLVSADGKLDFHQGPTASYTVNSDFYWYEIGDVICIGDINSLFYCFPKNSSVSVSKARLATEELYKIKKRKRIIAQ